MVRQQLQHAPIGLLAELGVLLCLRLALHPRFDHLGLLFFLIGRRRRRLPASGEAAGALRVPALRWLIVLSSCIAAATL
jgi:hypothetical protein